MDANIIAESARKRDAEAAHEADRPEAEAWPLQIGSYLRNGAGQSGKRHVADRAVRL
jgi:hypothetical protein